MYVRIFGGSKKFGCLQKSRDMYQGLGNATVYDSNVNENSVAIMAPYFRLCFSVLLTPCPD